MIMIEGSEQFKRAVWYEKRCFSWCDGACYGDYKNGDCGCFSFCFKIAKRMGHLE